MKPATLSIKTFLDRTVDRYHREDLLVSDPLEFVHRENDPWEKEAVALISALFAYGNVTQIRKSVMLAIQLTRSFRGNLRTSIESLADPAVRKQARVHFAPFYHRFNVGDDLLLLLTLIARSWKKHGSVGNHFMGGLRPESREITAALDDFLTDWLEESQALTWRAPSFRYLITRPQDGSCCKRWCMFLRWMGRKDSLDPGLWRAGSPLISSTHGLRADQLIMPLDTHTGRISQYIGLTQRKTLHWKAALEITERLREFDPEDPTRYDFALSRLGILDFCQKKFRQEICLQCDLVKVCHFARKNLTQSSSTAAR